MRISLQSLVLGLIFIKRKRATIAIVGHLTPFGIETLSAKLEFGTQVFALWFARSSASWWPNEAGLRSEMNNLHHIGICADSSSSTIANTSFRFDTGQLIVSHRHPRTHPVVGTLFIRTLFQWGTSVNRHHLILVEEEVIAGADTLGETFTPAAQWFDTVQLRSLRSCHLLDLAVPVRSTDLHGTTLRSRHLFYYFRRYDVISAADSGGDAVAHTSVWFGAA